MTHLDAIRAAGVLAVLRAPSPEAAISAVGALVAGGVTGIEITYSTPDATEVIRELRRTHGENITLGAGTVLTAAQADEAVDAGATFLVSPGTEAALASAMLSTGAAVLLGAMTPSEVMEASRLGAHVVKLFPASLGGPSFLKALRGPFPEVPLIPTGGVNAANIGEWVAAGAVAVGAGGDLCSASAMAQGRWDVIEDTARIFADAYAQATYSEVSA
ncbi:bifunctional 4-hydroxy-2-oxoglutarate aldolase/2-dehydro-3-deoxy-phosphogluconate aldolase [Rhodococcus globerulus]|uniref:Bifunctional 4-hydroxy-2-oxoglutarate aldolase/2-dehydro-3-deoxy-phosphogluconate aldolase n=1 Tax=Rhodococcus globerulus TaxID=33008 RepID=A0ABU4C381_RHOGO|nr:bifunctional 4-hydroxy-2-oxoglutarate aldolase/2-dehydro-3-deoxy-phosphogluconate aldolase [Rhodococcus globerulus]MDV6270874.1 bifunctional 4-hydroxy-2-oxoglutarate aldolase/2-dehydro-3-deoxy-phosphogluconate aldolase [Rhodococcus globerulus]